MKNETNPEMYPKWDMVTYRHKPKNHRKMDSRSMTIPDMSLTLQQILDRYSRGLPVTGQNAVPIWDEDDTTPDIRTLDLTERMDMAQQFRNELSQIHDRVNTTAENKKANKLRQEIRDELSAELAKNNKPVEPTV